MKRNYTSGNEMRLKNKGDETKKGDSGERSK